MQLGWKKLMESVAGWEEDFEESITLDYSEEDLQTWFAQEWTNLSFRGDGCISLEELTNG